MGRKGKDRRQKTTGKVAKNETDSLLELLKNDSDPLLLHYAAKVGDLGKVKDLIKKGYNVNFKEFFEYSTPIMIAAMYGHLEVVKVLFEAGADLELSDVDDVAPLQAAVGKDYVEVVEYFIAVGADVNKVHRDGNTELHVAAALGYLRIVEVLLKSDKIEINARNEEDGTTALWKASCCGYDKIVEVLIANGANIHLGNTGNIKPLHVAASQGHLAIAKQLIHAGHFINAVDNLGKTPLLYTVDSGNAEVVEFLISEGADVNLSLNKFGHNDSYKPLWGAVVKKHVDIIKLLVKSGADVNLVRIQDKVRLIDIAIFTRNIDIVKELINVPHIKILDEEGSTPLHLVAELGYDELIPVLLESKKIDINFRDRTTKSTPLLIAAVYGEAAAVKKLLDLGADAEITEDCMMNPLHAATGKSHIDIIKLLLTSIDVNIRGMNGCTVLHLSIGNMGIVKLLLKAGANPLLQDSFGYTPLDLAIEKKHKEITKILTRHIKNFTEQKVGSQVITDIKSLHTWYAAIKYGNIEIIKSFLLSGRIDINFRDHTGSTALHYAAYNGYLDIIELLFSLGNLNLNSLDYKERCAPLHLAAANNKADVIDILAKLQGIDINILAPEGTPLCSAVLKNKQEALEVLIALGADINKTNILGHSALHVAISKDYIKIVKILLSSPNINANLIDIEGFTPLMLAIKTKRIDITDLLIRSGKVDVNLGIDVYPVHLAVMSQNIEILKIILNVKNVDLDIAALNGYTVLHFAAYFGSIEMIKMLVQAKINNELDRLEEQKEVTLASFISNFISSWMFSKKPISDYEFKGTELTAAIYNKGITPLHIAISANRIDAAIFLIQLGISVNIADQQGAFPSHITALKGNIRLLNSILEIGKADVNTLSLDKGLTALHCAVATGNVMVVEALIKVPGINLNIIDWDNGLTPLFLALRNKDVVISHLLIRAGADVNVVCNELTAVSTAVIAGNKRLIEIIINSPGFDFESNLNHSVTKSTPLHIAVEQGRLDIVNFLLNCGFNPNVIDRYGSTALHSAVSKMATEIVKRLLAAGINLNISSKMGITALHIAAINNDIRNLKLLIDRGADVDAQTDDGVSALVFATGKGHLEIVEYLLQSKANVNVIDCLHNTPLHIAAENNRLEIAKLLLYYAVEVNALTIFNTTALHLAVVSGSIELIKLLISNGIDINTTDTKGETALHYAAAKGNSAVVKLLVGSGIDIHIANKNGQYASYIGTTAEIRTYLFTKEKSNKPSIKLVIIKQEIKESESFDSKELEQPLEVKNKIKTKKHPITPQEYFTKSDYFSKEFYHKYKTNALKPTTIKYTWTVDGNDIKSDAENVQKTNDIGGWGDLYVIIADKIQKKLDTMLLKKFKNAIDKGFVGDVGEIGMKKIKNKIISVKIMEDKELYTDKIYCNPDNQKLIIFDGICTHRQLQDKINNSHLNVIRVDAAEEKMLNGLRAESAWVESLNIEYNSGELQVYTESLSLPQAKYYDHQYNYNQFEKYMTDIMGDIYQI